MASVAGLRRMPRVEIVDDERSSGNGIIVTLRKGYSFSFSEDNRVRGFDDVFEAKADVRDSFKWAGPYTS